jgi:hypothetical protein
MRERGEESDFTHGELGFFRNLPAGLNKSFLPPRRDKRKLFILHFQRIVRPQLPYISDRFVGKFAFPSHPKINLLMSPLILSVTYRINVLSL